MATTRTHTLTIGLDHHEGGVFVTSKIGGDFDGSSGWKGTGPRRMDANGRAWLRLAVRRGLAPRHASIQVSGCMAAEGVTLTWEARHAPKGWRHLA